MSKSIKRVQQAAEAAGLAITVKRMGDSTRTAEEAAKQCGCTVAQIVKSLIVHGKDSDRLYLFLVPGDRMLDMDKAATLAGEGLERADPRRIRADTGFAIGGVSPIGHTQALPVFGDETLLSHATVWAAAGAHDAVFESEPKALFAAAGATAADLAR